MKVPWLFVAIAAIDLSACSSVVHVTRLRTEDLKETTKMNGLPFYIKVEQFKQTTVYAKTWLRATLNVEKKAKDKQTGNSAPAGSQKSAYVRDVLKNDPNLDGIRQALLQSNGTEAQALAVIDRVTNLRSIASDAEVTPIRTKNLVESQWAVDYVHTYYLNAPFPWFGTGNLTQKLNSDGTLSEVTSNPDSKVAEGISSLIPFKEFLSGKFVKSGAAATSDDNTKSDMAEGVHALRNFRPGLKPSETEFVYELSLSITEIGREYTLTKDAQATRADVSNPIELAEMTTGAAMFAVKDLGSTEEKKDDGQKIGIEGSINFPKDWGAAKPAEAPSK